MDKLNLGYVARAHGLRGELRVQLHDPTSEALFDVEQVWLGGKEYDVRAARETAGAVLLSVDGIHDRDAAEALRGSVVEVAREAVPLGEGEYFLVDLIGCLAVDESGASLGTVVAIQNGPQDLLVLHDDRIERLLPLVPEFLVSVDLPARKVVLAPPEDLPTEPLRGSRGEPR